LPRPYVWGFADIIRDRHGGQSVLHTCLWTPDIYGKAAADFSRLRRCETSDPLLVLSLFGCVVMFRKDTSKTDKQTAGVLLALAAFLLVILARSNADWAGVRHAMIVCIVMAIMAGFGAQRLLVCDRNGWEFWCLV